MNTTPFASLDDTGQLLIDGQPIDMDGLVGLLNGLQRPDSVNVSLRTSEAHAMQAEHRAVENNVDMHSMIGLPAAMLSNRGHDKVQQALETTPYNVPQGAKTTPHNFRGEGCSDSETASGAAYQCMNQCLAGLAGTNVTLPPVHERSKQLLMDIMDKLPAGCARFSQWHDVHHLLTIYLASAQQIGANFLQGVDTGADMNADMNVDMNVDTAPDMDTGQGSTNLAEAVDVMTQAAMHAMRIPQGFLRTQPDGIDASEVTT